MEACVLRKLTSGPIGEEADRDADPASLSSLRIMTFDHHHVREARPMARGSEPPLSSIDMCLKDVGRTAAEHLLAALMTDSQPTCRRRRPKEGERRLPQGSIWRQ